MLLFSPVVLGLRRSLPAAAGGARTLAAICATWIGLLGLVAVTTQTVIDSMVGMRSTDRQNMDEMFTRIQSHHPGVTPAVYTFGPMLFFAGLLALAGTLAASRPRPVSARTPALLMAGTTLMAASLDLLPLGAACYALALTPLVRREGDR